MREITETGIRGYLKWLQRDQPGIYAKVAPVLAQQVPEAFSDREQSTAMGTLMWGEDWGLDIAASGDSTSSASTDVADAANSGAASPSLTNIIGNVVSAASQIFLAKSQVDTLKQVNNIQLQRAAAGLAPLNTSSLSLGIPQVNVGVASGTLQAGGLALAAILGIGLLFAFSGGRRARA